MSNLTKATLGFIVVLVIASLLLNMFLLWQWFTFRQRMDELVQMSQISLAQAVADLGEFQDVTISTTIPIRQEIPVKLQVSVKDTLKVPITTTVDINKDIPVPPIELNGVKVPLNTVVPVRMKVPINFDQEVPLDLTIPVETTVPVKLDVPVEIKLSEAGLGPYIDSLRTLLVSFNETISYALR
jgi:hypothetical protein